MAAASAFLTFPGLRLQLPVPLSSASSGPSNSVAYSGSRNACLPRTVLRARRQVFCQATYTVKLITPQGETVLNVPDNEYILDAAEDNGVVLPYSCRSGACSSCAAVIKEGEVDQSNQTYLEDSQVEAGYVLTCVAYPLSDIVLETHREDGLY